MAVKQQVKSAVYMSGTNILFPISFNEIWNEINYIRLILSVFYDQSFSRTSTIETSLLMLMFDIKITVDVCWPENWNQYSAISMERRIITLKISFLCPGPRPHLCCGTGREPWTQGLSPPPPASRKKMKCITLTFTLLPSLSTKTGCFTSKIFCSSRHQQYFNLETIF